MTHACVENVRGSTQRYRTPRLPKSPSEFSSRQKRRPIFRKRRTRSRAFGNLENPRGRFHSDIETGVSEPERSGGPNVKVRLRCTLSPLGDYFAYSSRPSRVYFRYVSHMYILCILRTTGARFVHVGSLSRRPNRRRISLAAATAIRRELFPLAVTSIKHRASLRAHALGYYFGNSFSLYLSLSRDALPRCETMFKASLRVSCTRFPYVRRQVAPSALSYAIAEANWKERRNEQRASVIS